MVKLVDVESFLNCLLLVREVRGLNVNKEWKPAKRTLLEPILFRIVTLAVSTCMLVEDPYIERILGGHCREVHSYHLSFGRVCFEEFTPRNNGSSRACMTPAQLAN